MLARSCIWAAGRKQSALCLISKDLKYECCFGPMQVEQRAAWCPSKKSRADWGLLNLCGKQLSQADIKTARGGDQIVFPLRHSSCSTPPV